MGNAKSKLKKVQENIYEIPREGNMKVPGIIYMNEKLLKNVMDKTVEQVMNVATLPGIYGKSIAMPDAHMGYGFSVGGVAATDVKCGCISPGGVGYDINCLKEGTLVSTEFGSYKKIEDFENSFVDVEVSTNPKLMKKMSRILIPSLNSQTKTVENKEVQFFMKKKVDKITKIKTSLGFEIEATKDHPILTRGGMCDVGNLEKGTEIAITTFKGVEHQKITEGILVENLDISNQAKNVLEERNLLPLNMNSFKFPYLVKIFGYLLGDGTLYFSNGKGYLVFYGNECDLKEISKDMEILGFSGRLYSRKRDHSITDQYGTKEFQAECHELHVSSTSLAHLFVGLGFPQGKKVEQDFLIPIWLMNSPLWIKRLFLASFFGAELSSPSTHTKTGFYSPILSQNKSEENLDSGRQFMIQIMSLLEEFDIKVNKLSERKEFNNKLRLRLIISAEERNLINLWTKVGFIYNSERQKLADLSVLYILKKKKLTQKRSIIALKTKELKAKGLKLKEVQDLLVSEISNTRFIERHYYETVGQRISQSFISFENFKNESLDIISNYGTLFDSIETITEERYDGYVYDFTVEGNHNFIANGIIVSNCGVRLLQTSLNKEEVYPKVREILNELFRRVPCGVGKGGDLRLSKEQFEQVLTNGAKWAVENGLGNKEDLENCEENGTHLDAVPSYVGSKPFKRGKEQLGTLGAGNHFLEVQYVDKIFDEVAAETFGLKEGQVVAMIHCGSRGVGHQVCSDYLREIEREHPEIMKNIVDRELAYAPSDSEMGKKYYGAMCAAANYAWCNRHVIGHHIKETFKDLFDCEIHTVYDVAHNMAKKEKHMVDGEEKEVYVHRKGATRSFPPGRPEIPEKYRAVGQPVLIPGSMGTSSYVLVGGENAMELSFGSTAHGAGRVMSRRQAKETFNAEKVTSELEDKNIIVKSASWKGVVEEAPGVYKDVDEVVKISDALGIGKLVARLRPMGVVKG
jgi:tRNA-splicing ligase RtcB (3'-phosphate/5'-hydroxy nucleic acid ligase)